MFSLQQKRDIADAVQKILRDTKHPELAKGEIQFHLHVDGAEGEIGLPIDFRGTSPASRCQALISSIDHVPDWLVSAK